MIFASLIGGAVTDRVERRRLLVFGQSLIVANELFILTLLLFNKLEFWHMLCTAFIAGCAFPFIMPARMAITVNVVGPQRLQTALAFQAGALNFTRVVGPAMMGIVIAQTSFVNAYYFSRCSMEWQPCLCLESSPITLKKFQLRENLCFRILDTAFNTFLKIALSLSA